MSRLPLTHVVVALSMAYARGACSQGSQQTEMGLARFVAGVTMIACRRILSASAGSISHSQHTWQMTRSCWYQMTCMIGTCVLIWR